MNTFESPPYDAVAVGTDAALATSVSDVNAAAKKDNDSSASTLTRTGFVVADWNLLFPSSRAREVIATPHMSRLPNTASWLLGVANVRGNLMPIADLAVALGAPRDRPVPRYAMVFGEGEAAIGLAVDHLPHLFDMQSSERIAGIPPLPAVLQGSVLAAYYHADRTWLDLDLNRLIETLTGGIVL